LFVPWRRAQLKSVGWSQRLAECLQSEMNRALNGGSEAATYRSGSLALLQTLAMPAVLVEIGNASRPDFRDQVASTEFQNLAAATLAAGVERFRAMHQSP
jgi:N-acetylmuramoyl-L-alanine amidase